LYGHIVLADAADKQLVAARIFDAPFRYYSML